MHNLRCPRLGALCGKITYLSLFTGYIYEGDTPFLVRSIQGVFRRYAVRKGSVRSTQKTCYIVRKHLFLLLKSPIFIKKHNKRDIQSQITLNFLRARFARASGGGHFEQHL